MFLNNQELLLLNRFKAYNRPKVNTEDDILIHTISIIFI